MISTIALASATHAVGPWGGGFGFLFFLIPLFWFGLFVLFAVLMRRRWARAAGRGEGYGFGPGYGHPGWRSPGRSAELTLAERFAQGDIDETEYRARLEVLRANNGPATS